MKLLTAFAKMTLVSIYFILLLHALFKHVYAFGRRFFKEGVLQERIFLYFVTKDDAFKKF